MTLSKKLVAYMSLSTGIGFIALLSFLCAGQSALAEDINCLLCHEQLSKEKVVHAALQMGCPTCHTGINAADVPHKKTNNVEKGLSSAQPDLCFGCHDKAKFQKKTVHAAVAMGCTGCHNPHSSKNAKLLVSEMPDLCFNCHDKKLFMGKKNIHPPVMGGMCTGCHNPHASDAPKLLLSEPPALCYNCHDKSKFTGKQVHAPIGAGMCTSCHSPHQSDNEKLLIGTAPDLCYNCHDKAAFSNKNVHAPVAGGMCLGCHKPHAAAEPYLLKNDAVRLCLECHPAIKTTPHAIAGFGGDGHPLGYLQKKKKPLEDPSRPGKRFYCGSCHNPHSTDTPKLFRFEAKSGMALCGNCHKF